MSDNRTINLPLELLLLALLSTLWGASFTFIKVGVETIPPITLIAVRTLIAGLVLVAVLRWRGLKLPRDIDSWKLFIVQAVLNSALPFTLIAAAERTIDAGLATILNSLTPVFTFLLTAFVSRHEVMTGRKLIGAAVGLSGVFLIVGMQAMNGLGKELWAQLAVVAAALSYGWAAIFSRNFKGMDPVMPAAGSLLCGAVLLAPLSLAFERPWTLSPSASSIAALIALSVLSTALAFFLYFRLLGTLGVGATAQAYLRVPIGVAIGVIFLGETVTGAAAAGLVLVLAGVAAMTLPARGRKPAAKVAP